MKNAMMITKTIPNTNSMHVSFKPTLLAETPLTKMKFIQLARNSKVPPVGTSPNKTSYWLNANDLEHGNCAVLCGNKRVPKKGINKGKTLMHNNGITVFDIDFVKPCKGWKLEDHSFIQRFGRDYIKKFDTFTVKTAGGGVHLYFQYTELRSVINGEYDIDILNDGRFAVAPGTEVNGVQYSVVSNTSIKPMPLELKEWIENSLYQRKKSSAPTSAKESRVETDLQFDIPDALFYKVAKNLDESYFTSYGNWLKWTTFCKRLDRGQEWDQINQRYKGYHLDKNISTWDSIEPMDSIVFYILNQALGMKPNTAADDLCYKSAVQYDVEYQEIIKKKKLGYQFITDLVKSGKKTIVIKSDTGTGKTTSFGSYIHESEAKFISLTSRVSLAEEQYENVFATRFGIDVKLYNMDGVQFNQNDNMIVQLDSIAKLNRIDMKGYTVFIDEFASLMEYLMTSDTLKKVRLLVFCRLLKILEDVESVICVDADIDDICLKYLRHAREEIYTVRNEYKHNKKVKAFELNDYTELLRKLKVSAKYFVCCDSKTEAEELWKKLGDETVKLITSDTVHIGDLDRYDRVIFSPKIIYGLDSSIKRAVFTLYTSRTISPKAMIQQICRARDIECLYFMFIDPKYKSSVYETVEECMDFIVEQDCLASDLFVTYASDDEIDLYTTLYVSYEYQNDCYATNKRVWFKMFLRQRGFELEEDKVMELYKHDRLEKWRRGHAVKEYKLENWKDYVKDRNEILCIPDEKLEVYKNILVDQHQLATHLRVRRFFFTTKNRKQLEREIRDSWADFGSQLITHAPSRIHFILTLMKETKCEGFNPTQGVSSKEKADDLFKRYILTFNSRKKKVLDLTRIDKVTYLLKECYDYIDRETICSTRDKMTVYGKRENCYRFEINESVLDYHKTVFEFKHPDDDVKVFDGYHNSGGSCVDGGVYPFSG